ncbi:MULTISPECIES: hypothetical protein [unclassified Streptomyces]|uniref:hypothetical protein n=1 Tax=unclassified Streptomyces TaxID=2593676 RepID=UPI002E220616
MSDLRNRKYIRNPFIYGAAIACAAIALLVAYLLGAFEKREDIKAENVCRNVPDRPEAAKTLNSVLPGSPKYHFVETWRPDADWGFRSVCGVEDDDNKALFYLDAKAGPATPWPQWAKTHIPPNDGGKISYFNAGLKGISNSEVAAIWVPCYDHEKTSNARYNMTVFADALKPLEASDKEARQTLIDLATSFARQAHKDAKCDLPSKLPS